MRFMPTSITTAPGLDRLGAEQPRHADRGDQDVGAAADGGQVAGARVADGDGRVRGQQQACHRHADQLRAADDDRLGALQLDALVAQQLHHAGRRAGHQARACRGPAGRRWSGSARRRPCRDRSRRRPRSGSICSGSGQLDEDAVDVVVASSAATSSSSSSSLGLAGQAVVDRAHPGLLAGPVLVARRRSPRPGRRRRSPWPAPACARSRPRSSATSARDPLAHRGRDRLAVDDPRRHLAHRLRIGA